MIDLATTDQEIAVTRERLAEIAKGPCPKCGAQLEPEPTDEERARLLADPDFHWHPPDGVYLCGGFGLMGGGYGPYMMCDGCGFTAKLDLGPEAE